MRNNSEELWLSLTYRAGELEDSGNPVECSDKPDLFFPEDYYSLALRARAESEAKEICARCSIRDLCAAYALAAKEPAGVWGGYSAADRLSLRTRLR